MLIGTLYFLRRHRVDWRQPSGDCANLKPASTTAMLVGERPREATRGIAASYATRAFSRLSDLRTGDSVSLFFFAYVRKQTRFTRVASSYVHKWNLPSRLFSFISQCNCVGSPDGHFPQGYPARLEEAVTSHRDFHASCIEYRFAELDTGLACASRISVAMEPQDC